MMATLCSLTAAAKQFTLSFVIIFVSTTSPLAVQAQEAVPGFEHVGFGGCLDANGNGYDNYSKAGVAESIADCGSSCEGTGIDGLVGFSIRYTDFNSCVCDFDDGIVTSTLPDGFDYSYFDASGTGEVTSTSGTSGYFCYKITVPSEEPSLTPSQSPTDQPSLKPSLEPSLVPSIFPSASIQPSPFKVEGFEYVGAGACLDASGNYYDNYVKSGVKSNADCASACEGIEVDGFVGFTFYIANSGGKCLCYFDDKNVITTNLPDGFTESVDFRSGAGEVASTNELSEFSCFKVHQYSYRPSTDPSQSPSNLPSVMPSSVPFDQPSLVPSASLQPSLSPSTSLQPSIQPSVSSKPSYKPSNSFQPSSPPSTYIAELAPTQAPKTLLPPMWYPDWTGANEGCINDGNEDDYMRLNPTGYYLFETLESCCSKHYSWNYNQCAGIESNAVGPNGEALYYPDWEGENRSCKNDGRQPDYMSKYPEAWMFSNLASCCEKRYHWNLDECMGSLTDTAFYGSGNWYPDWEGSICVQDCVGAFPCGGLAHVWDPQYTSAAACCDSMLNWVTDCNTKSMFSSS